MDEVYGDGNVPKLFTLYMRLQESFRGSQLEDSEENIRLMWLGQKLHIITYTTFNFKKGASIILQQVCFILRFKDFHLDILLTFFHVAALIHVHLILNTFWIQAWQ